MAKTGPLHTKMSLTKGQSLTIVRTLQYGYYGPNAATRVSLHMRTAVLRRR